MLSSFVNRRDLFKQLSIYFKCFDAKNMLDKELKHRLFECGENYIPRVKTQII